jgi:DNA repair protein RadC
MVEKVCNTSSYHSKIKEWPEQDRPRERLLECGVSYLSDAELLALLIGSGSDGITAVDLAKRLLVEHQNLTELASKGIAEFVRMKGIGPARSARVVAAFELGRRIDAGKDKREIKVSSPKDIAEYYITMLRDLKYEIFKVILLNSANKIIRDVTVSQGILNASIVHPREVFKAAIDNLAAGVILLHNHPSGDPFPSKEDQNITTQILKAGQILDIPVLDHIIVTRERYFSFLHEGRLIKE